MVLSSSTIQLLKKSSPPAASSLLYIANSRADVILLNSLMGSRAVCYYGIASRLAEPFFLVASGFSLSLYSQLAKHLASNPAFNVRRFLIRYSVGLLAYGGVSALILALVAPIFITRFLPAYAPTIPIIPSSQP